MILTLAAFTAATLASCSDQADDVEPDQPRTTLSAEAVEASLAAAEEYFQSHDQARAEAILFRLIDQAPDEPRALELHAQVLMSRAADARDEGDHRGSTALFEQAYERYREVVALLPSSGGLHQSAGEVAQMAGRDDEALEHYEQAQQLSPHDIKPPFLAAQIRIARGDHEQAVADLQQVLRIDPDEPLAYASLASLAAERGQFDVAIEHIAEARAIRPGDVSFRVIEASIYRRRGEPEHAIELLIGLPPEQRVQWFVTDELAATHAALGEHREAADAWAAHYKAHPASPRAWRAAVNAGEALLEAGDREDAMIWLDEARLAAPNRPETEALARAIAEHGEQR